MMLEDEVVLAEPPAMFDEFVAAESPIVCTPWICKGHRNRAEMDAVHDAIDSCYAAPRD